MNTEEIISFLKKPNNIFIFSGSDYSLKETKSGLFYLSGSWYRIEYTKEQRLDRIVKISEDEASDIIGSNEDHYTFGRCPHLQKYNDLLLSNNMYLLLEDPVEKKTFHIFSKNNNLYIYEPSLLYIDDFCHEDSLKRKARCRKVELRVFLFDLFNSNSELKMMDDAMSEFLREKFC